MRTGVIAQKLGMTRIFTDAGEHVPVTVLKLDSCQVVAHRTDGQGRLHRRSSSASARPRSKNVLEGRARPLRRGQGRARSASSPSSACTEDALDPGRRRDHRRPLRRRARSSTSRAPRTGKGFAGGMKRWNFGGLRATHGVSVSHRSHRLDRRPPGSGQDLQEQEDGRPSRRRARHHPEPARRAASTSSAA